MGRIDNCRTGITYLTFEEAIKEAADGDIIQCEGFFDEDIILPKDKMIHIHGCGRAIHTGKLDYHCAKEGCKISCVDFQTPKGKNHDVEFARHMLVIVGNDDVLFDIVSYLDECEFENIDYGIVKMNAW